MMRLDLDLKVTCVIHNLSIIHRRPVQFTKYQDFRLCLMKIYNGWEPLKSFSALL